MAENNNKTPKKKYLTEERFFHFIDNDFFHMSRTMAKIEGKLSIITPLVCAILTVLVSFLIYIAIVGL